MKDLEIKWLGFGDWISVDREARKDRGLWSELLEKMAVP